MRTLGITDLEGCLLSCFLYPTNFLSLPACLLSLLSLEWVHKEECPPPAESRSSQEGHRDCRSPICVGVVFQDEPRAEATRWEAEVMLLTERTARRWRWGAHAGWAEGWQDRWPKGAGRNGRATNLLLKKAIRFLPHDSTAAEYTWSAFSAQGPSSRKGQFQNHQKGICSG